MRCIGLERARKKRLGYFIIFERASVFRAILVRFRGFSADFRGKNHAREVFRHHVKIPRLNSSFQS